MGRFRDLWQTGKFIRQAREATDRSQMQEGASLFQELSPELAVPEASKEIFSALKLRRGEETGRWLNSLAKDLPASRSRQAIASDNLNDFDKTKSLIEALFKEFADLAFEFNKSAVTSDLLISLDRPTLIEKKTDEVWYRPVSRIIQGRLTTRQWALIVSGQDKKISIVLLPAAMLLAFTAGQVSNDEYPPFTEILLAPDGANWTIGGQVIPESTMPHLAMELLGDLIRVSSGVMSESELFSPIDEKPKLGENLAVGYQPTTAEQSPAATSSSTLTEDDSGVHDACDLLDAAIDRELKELYTQASTMMSDSKGADLLRKKVSALEGFKSKITSAFEEYSHTALPDSAPNLNQPAKVELLH